MATTKEYGWTILLRCQKGHILKSETLLVNVDGHAVVPLPGLCPSCISPDRELTRSEKRRLHKALRRMEG